MKTNKEKYFYNDDINEEIDDSFFEHEERFEKIINFIIFIIFLVFYLKYVLLTFFFLPPLVNFLNLL